MKNKHNSADKLIFFYECFKAKRDISAHIFNNVFCEFEEKFYKQRAYKLAMSSFKKHLKIACENKGHEIMVVKVNRYETVVQGIISVWHVKYNFPPKMD